MYNKCIGSSGKTCDLQHFIDMSMDTAMDGHYITSRHATIPAEGSGNRSVDGWIEMYDEQTQDKVIYLCHFAKYSKGILINAPSTY